MVRGAGAIGAAGGFGTAQAALEAPEAGFDAYMESAERLLKATRPTARNLFYAVDRVLAAVRRVRAAGGSPAEARRTAVAEAEAVAREDTAACVRIGEIGAALVTDGARILTHCNAGWLGFSDWGTALAPLYRARRDGKRFSVWVDETRPRLQGARLTAWELANEGIDFQVIPDNAAGWLMRRGEVDLVIVGSDRIAANGDVANKVGTYEKAVCARANGVPFYVAAPLSTFDAGAATGDDIPIEERDPGEVLLATGPDAEGTMRTVSLAAPGAGARNPAFDVTPADLITGIVTERGILRPHELAGAATGAPRSGA
ncbi:MAG: S-methyl-5-thioribose-1-phosphate isomerase [Spirochaetes bacterium]|nr:S-methyl-5-thioribose-1-phosphate isomerase [Spirochaetota bacterium]